MDFKILTKLSIYKFHALSFFMGLVLMTLEITASRIVAPFIGNSIYSWTSIIGVILLSLSFGNIFGGYLSDKYADKKILSFILILCGVSISVIPIINKFIPLILAANPSFITNILLISFALFFVPSFLLGASFPFFLKFSANNLTEIGLTSGKLSSLSSLGSIVGTFLTGFFFISHLGTSRTLLILSSFLFFCGIALNIPKKLRPKIISFSSLIILLIFSFNINKLGDKTNQHIIYEQSSNYYNIMVAEDTMPANSLRLLFLDDSIHSIESLGSDELMAPYTHLNSEIVQTVSRNPKRIAIIGGGSYSLPKNLKNIYSSAFVEVIEIDKQVTTTAEKFFGLDSSEIITTTEDARLFFAKNKNSYDVIINDAYNSTISVPWHLTTQEFLTDINNSLSDDGVYIANFISSSEKNKSGLLKSYHKTATSIIPDTFTLKTLNSSSSIQNMTIISLKNPDQQTISALTQKFKNAIIDKSFLNTSDSILLTDNFAPVERLMLPVVNDYYAQYLNNFYIKFLY